MKQLLLVYVLCVNYAYVFHLKNTCLMQKKSNKILENKTFLFSFYTHYCTVSTYNACKFKDIQYLIFFHIANKSEQ